MSTEVDNQDMLNRLLENARTMKDREHGPPLYSKEMFDRVTQVTSMEEATMTGEQKPQTEPEQKPKQQPGLLVEDTSVVGGRDKVTGQPVIRPKTPDGKADKLTEATDPRERSE